MNSRITEPSTPLLDVLSQRWSPRSFNTEHSFPEGALRSMFEAARWAPSANNSQPWRFIIARRGSESFAKIEAALIGFNQMWAGDSAALIVNIAETASAEGKVHTWAEYDLGQAVAHLSVQAQSEGLHLHQIGGFDREAIRTAFDLETRFLPVSITAIGALGSPDRLSQELRERETAPRTRLPLEELVLVQD